MAWLLTVGFLSLVGQVVLLREVLVAFHGSEIALLAGAGVVMAGTALGALPRLRGPVSRPAAGLLVFAPLLPILLAGLRLQRLLLGGTPGADLPLAQQMLCLLLSCLPFGACTGVLFRQAAQEWIRRGGALAAAYAWESLGGVLGGAGSALAAWAGLPNWATALSCGAAAALAASLSLRRSARPWLHALALAEGAAILGALLASAPVDACLTGLEHPGLLAAKDTPYGRIAVVGNLGQVSVFENGALAFESQGTSAEEFVHLAALQTAVIRKVLILGGAIEGLPAEALKHAPRRVDVVELDRQSLETAWPHLPPRTRTVFSEPGVRLIIGDPRRVMNDLESYDLILAAMPEPASGQTNRYDTREFFTLCRSHLNPGGVLGFRLRSAENLWSPVLAARNAGIARALRDVFPDTLFLPATDAIVLAAPGQLSRDPEAVISRMEARRITARLVTPPYLRYLLTNDRVAEAARILERTPAPANTDARPSCYAAALALGLSRFLPAVGAWVWPRSLVESVPWAWILMAPLAWACLCLAARRHPAARAAMWLFAAGFCGMLVEGALILFYQTARAVLYQDLGWLLCSFMAGLAIGAAPWHSRKEGAERVQGMLWVVVSALLTCACSLALNGEHALGLAGTMLFLLAIGASTGWAFSLAASWRPKALGTLYAADLLGGAAGAVLGGAVILPVLGLPAGTLLAALVILATSALI